jgi:hypothetical protein
MAAINKNFVVRHGIEVGDNLIYGDKANLKVGIGTTVPGYTLDVRGGIGATSVSVGQTITANSGVVTSLTINGGTLKAGGSAGSNGQYLKSTGTGVAWETFPTARTSDTFIATEGQTTFSFAYNVGFIDVFVNGVRLTGSEFTANDGLTVVLNTSRRGGDIVDVVGYAINGIGAGTSGISGITIRDEGVTIGSANAVTSINFVGSSVTSIGTGAGVTVIISSGLGTDTNIETTGIITASKVRVGSATTFVEDLVVQGNARITGILTIGTASITIDGNSNTLTVPNLVVTNNTTGVIASGVAVTIRDSGSNIGDASVLDFGDNLSVSFSAGIATITGAASAGAGGTWSSNSVGIYTSRNVGIGTTNPTSALTVKGNTSLETLSVSGVSTFSGNVSFGSSALFGDTQRIILGSDSDLEIFHNGTVAGYIRNYTGNLAIQSPGEIEVSSLTRYYARFTESFGALLYDNNNQIRLQTLGAGVTVTGTTFTNQLNVSGVSTLSSNVSVGGTISIDGGVTLETNNVTIVGTSGTTGEIKQIGGAPFFYDGSAWREFVLSSGTPVSVPADTEWDSVVLRTTFDDNFTDAKFGVSPVRVSSGSTIVGSPVKIGTGAYRNIGGNVVGVGVSYAYRSDYDFTGSWTIEFWIYHDSTPVAYESLVSQVSTADDSGDWTFGMYNNGFNIYWAWDNENHSGGTRTLHAEAISSFNTSYLDKWTHYALVREGNNGSIHFYINGVETSSTINNTIIDNDILHINGAGLGFGALFNNNTIPSINGNNWNNSYCIDAIFDDVRISCGVGTAGQRYTSVGIATTATFTPPTTALPTTGTLSSYVQPPGDKYGEIGLGTSPTWRGTSGVTVSQQSSGNYRVSFASSYTNSNDYYVLSQGMDQGFASYVGIARSTTHVDLTINKQSDDTAVDTGALAVQIKNHI